MPTWLALALCNLLLILLFGLIASAIMLAQDPPGYYLVSLFLFNHEYILGIANSITAAPLKTDQNYNTTCFSFDDSCDQSKQLWCVNGRCQCYDQLAFWNTSSSSCQFCPNTFYYNGLNCVCPSYKYLYTTNSSSSCRYYQNISQTCNSSLQCTSTPNLSCINSTCQCDSGYYWNSTTNDTKGACGKLFI
jgi:hypothetical protein